MGRPTIIDPGEGGGGGGSPGIDVGAPGAATVGAVQTFMFSGFSLTPYPEAGRIDVQAMPQGVAFLAPASAASWLLMPAALTELFGSTILRQRADLTGASQARLIANVSAAGAAAAALRVQYSLDAAAWDYLDGSSGPSAGIGSTGLSVSSWVTLVSAAVADVYLRVVGISGDGATSPDFGAIALQVR